MVDRRKFLIGSGMIAAATALGARGTLAQGGTKVRFAIGQKAVAPNLINLLIGGGLGYFEEEGLELEFLTVGAVVNALVALEKGDVDIATGNPPFSLPILSKGEWGNAQNFYQYTYPYKWDVAVLPGSDIRTYADLKGKRVGVTDFGGTEYPVTKNVIRTVGVDPDSEVTWMTVGPGVPAGVALQNGEIDALAYYDTGFGQIEAAGLPFELVQRPENLPMIGGFFLMANRDRLQADPQFAIGYGRAVAKSSLFLMTNPTAGAKVFLSLYPETAPRGVSEDEAIASILTATARRIKLYQPPYEGALLGSINPIEFEMEAEMNAMTLPDMSNFYTNDLIDEINNFDRASVEAQANAYA